MKEDELWMNKIKERLEDYSEPLPVSGWERLERELSAALPVSSRIHKQVIFRRWVMSAAAALLVAVSSVSLWLMYSPVADEVRRAAVPALAVAPDGLPGTVKPNAQAITSEPVARRGAVRQVGLRSLIAQQLEKKEDALSEIEEEHSLEKEAIQEVEQEKEPAVVKEERVLHRPSSKDKLHLPKEKRNASKQEKWSVGLSVGNTGGLSLMDNATTGNIPQNSPGGMVGKLDLSATANGILTVPNGQELVFENGMPYLRNRGDQIADIKHKQPLSFGFSVRKGLPKGFSVETGLTYTYLSSDVTFEGSSEISSQKLHYIGIPLRANWNFVNAKRFTMYVSAGGAIEKCVYGKIGSKSETVNPLQLSVMGAVGAQYNVTNRVGLYVEPGVSYFFDDGSALQTIRKETPCNFTLQAGVRLTY